MIGVIPAFCTESLVPWKEKGNQENVGLHEKVSLTGNGARHFWDATLMTRLQSPLL